jgi:phosphoribosylformylglycinamidine synthase
MSLDGNGRYCALDPREGTKLIVAECCRNLSTVGALPMAATNNLNFGNPERPEIMAQIVAAIEGLAEACRFFDVPITGGNVSLYNETLGDPIFPTPVVGIIGRLPIGQLIGRCFKTPGAAIFLLGGLGSPDCHELGGTQYAKVVHNLLWGIPPKLDMDYEKRVQSAVRELVRERVVESSHDLSDGGLAVAIAESSFGPGTIGAEISLDSDIAPELLLFHEGPSRILISTLHPEAVRATAARYSVEAVQIGVTLESRVIVRHNKKTLIDNSIQELERVWSEALVHLLHNPVLV